jgi:hypothetical protein
MSSIVARIKTLQSAANEARLVLNLSSNGNTLCLAVLVLRSGCVISFEYHVLVLGVNA